MKKGWIINPTVDLIILLIGLVVLLLFLFPDVFDFIAGSQDILETETVPVIVDKAMLSRAADSVVSYEGKTYGSVQTMLEKFMAMPSNTPENILVRQYYDPDDERSKYRWAFAKIVADRLYDCAVKTAFQSENLAEFLAVSETKPTTCIICYNIHVAPDARTLLRKADSIGEFGFSQWLKLYSPKSQKQSYYDLLLSGFKFPEGLPETRAQIAMQKNIDNILKSDSEDDIAVVFVHVPLVGGQWARIPGIYGESGNVDFVSLYSLKNLASTTLISFERDFAGLDIAVPDINARCGRS